MITIDFGERTAVVSGNVTEKYARKLLQDKLKEDTPFKGGWWCYLTNRQGSRGTDINAVTVDDDYIFEISNPFAEMAGYI